MPALPFSKDGEVSQKHLARKRSEPQTSPHITIKMAQEFIAMNKQCEQQQRKQRQQTQEEYQYGGFRHDYEIGDTIKCPTHMIIKPSPKGAVLALNSLEENDYAFIRRSNGSYSYALLARRSFSVKPVKGDKSNGNMEEECMIFITDMGAICSTKMIRRRHWGDTVRLVSKSEQGLGPHLPTVPNATQEIPCVTNDMLPTCVPSAMSRSDLLDSYFECIQTSQDVILGWNHASELHEC